ncbi:MAG: hypothetical protein K8S99_06780 [Planctomycetes bacterium]|nr:hypothetical protein [Planctomycetota bacterium]
MPFSHPRIVNIINFIRAVEPRLEMDLVEPVRRQIELLTRHRLPGTWLLQYDALTQGPYVEMLKAMPAGHEVGGWFEVVRPLVEKAGLAWRGRYAWDWHAHVGFSIGYTPAEREKLADVFMADFRAAFGRYPASVGSWLMDAHLLGYMHDRYGLVASCNCKDQWGTDGYTLWGGYWNQAYYPSRRNMCMPAQHEASQVPVPIFRMLGSDPIYQYDSAFYDDTATGETSQSQSVVTLEPVYKEGGGTPSWVRWFFDVLAAPQSLSFSYTQVGQENSFGWPRMAEGLTDQVELLAEQVAQGGWRVETLETSARWFKKTFPVTPASAVVAQKDYRNEGRQSVWYHSRFYRANFFWEGDRFYIRDIHKFDEAYAERYLTAVCATPACTYDTLPVVEGMLWSDAKTRAALTPMTGGAQPVRGGGPVIEETNPGELTIRWPLATGGELRVVCRERGMEFVCSTTAWHLAMTWAQGATTPFRDVQQKTLRCLHNGHGYTISCTPGVLALDATSRRLTVTPEAGRLVMALDV